MVMRTPSSKTQSGVVEDLGATDSLHVLQGVTP